jgi:UDP-glucose 4-epimerase
MKSLVTGGAGFIGSHIVDLLIKEGHEVTVIDNLSMGKIDNVNKKARFIKGDILDYALIEPIIKDKDYIFHNAAKVSVRNSVNNLIEDANVNIIGTLNILRAMKDSKVKRLIFASSMGVYGSNGYSTEEAASERILPSSPYGIGKLAAEKYCLHLARLFNKECIVLRYNNTYGTRQTPTPYVGVITIFINNMLKNIPCTIYGDGNQVRDYIHVSDVAYANIIAMKTKNANEIYNIGTGIGTSVNDIYQLVSGMLGNNLKAVFLPKNMTDLDYFTPSIKRAELNLGFKAKHMLKDKIGEVIDHLKNAADA